MTIEDRLAALEAANAEMVNELGRLQDVEAIRRVQYSYGYFMDKWLFPEIVDLFADDAEMHFLNGIFRGRAGAERLYGYAGPETRGPRDGLLFEHFFLSDVVDVAPDRRTAKARFHCWLFVSVHKSVQADYPDWPAQFWEGGIYEHEYVRQDGRWLIKNFDYQITYQANYEDGWANAPDVPLMVRPFPGTFPEHPGGPDELREMPQQWPRATFKDFHYPHPTTGRAIERPAM